MLTCTVVATADENPDTQDFGRNLQRLLGTSHSFSSRAALPGLWRALQNWCTRARKRGDPVREMALPPPGVGAHIGLTNAISFPAWRDLHALRRWFEAHPASARGIRKPVDVAIGLCPEIRPDGKFGQQLVAAADEYATFYRRGTSLLHLHRLWSAACRALDRAVHENRLVSQRLRVELEVGAIAADTRVRLVPLERNGAEDPVRQPVSYRVDDLGAGLAGIRNERVTAYLRARLDSGAVPFLHQRFGLWVADFTTPSGGTDG